MAVDEPTRLQRLRLYDIMDSVAESSFDDLTRLASAICDCPISLVSLVDDQRQWFKSKVGLDASETPREQAFCAHAITGESLFVIEDATKDARFVDNPLVTGNPDIRFYAGAPLEVEPGVRLGTLCVIDNKPRTLSEQQREALGVLRDAVVNLLSLRRAKAEIMALEQHVPVCAWCRKVEVKDEHGSHWIELHDYLSADREISHGICPSCVEQVKKRA